MLAAISEGEAGPLWTEIFESRLRPLWDGSEERSEIEPVRLLSHSCLANEPSSFDGISEFYESCV
jgi:hypothetical protein